MYKLTLSLNASQLAYVTAQAAVANTTPEGYLLDMIADDMTAAEQRVIDEWSPGDDDLIADVDAWALSERAKELKIDREAFYSEVRSLFIE